MAETGEPSPTARWDPMIRLVVPLALAIAACHAPGAVTSHVTQAELAPGPLTVLHVLDSSEGIAVRGAPAVRDGRLYLMAGEGGPSGTPGCNSTALWSTTEHTQRCPGSIVSVRLDDSRVRVDHAFGTLDDRRRNSDGYHPYGTLAVGCGGNLLGVTQLGGVAPGALPELPPGFGVLFALTPAADDLDAPGDFEVLHQFFGEPRAADGEYPMGTLAVDPATCNVFGTAKGGGLYGSGTVWEWSPGGAFRFAPLPAGAGETYGGLTLAGGLLHGTTWAAGTAAGTAAGAYFTVDPATLAVRIVARFPEFTLSAHGTDNTPIQAPLALRDGTVLAVREWGGPAGTGLVARLDPATGITPLWSPADMGPVDVAPRFANATGAMLNGQAVEGRDGMVYGAAQYGGSAGTGGIYRIARDGTMPQLLWSWPDAAYPYGGLMLGGDGVLYGVTFNTGQVFRFDPRASAAVCGGGG